MPVATFALPSLSEQAERLVAYGVHELAGLSAATVRSWPGAGEGLLVVHPDVVAPTALTPLLERDGRPGFVVIVLPDADDFAPIEGLDQPEGPCYVVEGIDRGDAMANWSPAEALPAITSVGRTPLTLSEGICWLLQRPDVLERNRCFMTIGSRRCLPNGRLDARTPAIWISNGTGRDGKANRNAPKVGWCWAGNRHTWLGFASAAARRPSPRASRTGASGQTDSPGSGT